MQFRLAITFALFVLAAPGCFFHGGYPNGYYAPGPSVVPQTPSNGFPSGPFYQPGGTYTAPMNGSPTYVPQNSPGTGGPTLSNPGSNPTYDSPSGSNGNAPGFNPETPSGGKTVPSPDDGTSYERGTQRPTLMPTSSSNSSATEPEDETPFTQTESRRLPRNSYDSPDAFADTETEFERPAVRQTSSVAANDEEIQFANAPSRAKASPYGHHPEFNWVQGTVDYDDDSKTWSIMYDDHPKASDQLGGDLTLADHPMLTRLNPGDAVRMEGSIDENETDGRGKPVFRVTRFKKQ